MNKQRDKNRSFDSLDQVQQKKLAVKILLWFYKEKLRDLPDSMRNDLTTHVHQILKSHSKRTAFHSPRLTSSSHGNTSGMSDENASSFLELPTATAQYHPHSSKKDALKVLCATDSDSDISVLKSLNTSNNPDLYRIRKSLKFSKRQPVSSSTPERITQSVMTALKPSSSKNKDTSAPDECFSESSLNVVYVHDKACQVGLDLEDLVGENHVPSSEMNVTEVVEATANATDSSEAPAKAQPPPVGKTEKNICFEIPSPPVQCKSSTPEPPVLKPVGKSVAWYEPYQYQPLWAKKKEEEVLKPVRSTLQDALASKLPTFVSRSQERQRRIRISAEERKLEEVWSQEREQVFGFSASQNPVASKYSKSSDIFKRLHVNQRQMVSATTKKYKKLPEVIERKERQAREKKYAENRQKALAYKKKIQNQIIGRAFCV